MKRPGRYRAPVDSRDNRARCIVHRLEFVPRPKANLRRAGHRFSRWFGCPAHQEDRPTGTGLARRRICRPAHRHRHAQLRPDYPIPRKNGNAGRPHCAVTGTDIPAKSAMPRPWIHHPPYRVKMKMARHEAMTGCGVAPQPVRPPVPDWGCARPADAAAVHRYPTCFRYPGPETAPRRCRNHFYDSVIPVRYPRV